MEHDTLRRSEELRQTDALFNESYDDDADFSFDDRNIQSKRMEDMTIADLPDSEREKVSRLVEKLVSLGREQEELVADLAYERSRHANEIEASNQKLLQRCCQFEQEKGQLEVQLTDANRKHRSHLSLLHLYQVSLEKHVVDNAAMNEALAVAATGGTVGINPSAYIGTDVTERERELKETIRRMEVLSRSQQAMIETMQSAHQKANAAHQITVADLSFNVLKLTGADDKLRDCESRLAQALMTKSDIPTQSDNSMKQKQHLITMERACEGMARQLTEMTLRLEEKEDQIRFLTRGTERNRGSVMMLNSSSNIASAGILSASISSTATEISAEHHASPSSIFKFLAVNREGGESWVEKDDKAYSRHDSNMRQKEAIEHDADSMKYLHPSGTIIQRGKDEGRERKEDGIAFTLSSSLGSKGELLGDARSTKSWTSLDTHNITDLRANSPMLSHSPRREAGARMRSERRSDHRDVAQYNQDINTTGRHSSGEGVSLNLHEENHNSRVKKKKPPFPIQTHPLPSSAANGKSLSQFGESSSGWRSASPQRGKLRIQGSPLSGSVDDVSQDSNDGHTLRKSSMKKGNQRDQQRQVGKKEHADFRSEVSSSSYLNARTQGQMSSPSQRGYIASVSSATERKGAPSSSVKLSLSHAQQPRRQTMRCSDGELPHPTYQQPIRNNRVSSHGNIPTVNGAMNHVLPSSVAADREKRRGQEGVNSTAKTRDKEKERNNNFSFFDGERDGYDPQLFDLLDSM